MTPSRFAVPSQERYNALLVEEALRAGMNPRITLGLSRRRGAPHIRFRTWRALHDQGFSVVAISKRANKHWSTVIHGLKVSGARAV